MLKSLAFLMMQKSVAASGFDSDADAFIAAAGITDNTQKTAINDLVIAAKATGWWAECKAIYPFVGGSANSHKYNLKDPRDLDAAFRLNFVNAWTHSANGVTGNGSNTYADTFLIPSTDLTSNDTHISIYSRTNVAENKTDIGVYSDASFLQGLLIYTRFGDGFSYNDQYQYTTSRISYTNNDSRGYYLATRRSGTDYQVYKNGLSQGTNVGSAGTIPSKVVYIGALNSNGTPANQSSRQYAFATIGYGISNSIATAMYNDIQAFQTALSRQV